MVCIGPERAHHIPKRASKINKALVNGKFFGQWSSSFKVNTHEMEDFSKALDETLSSQTQEIRALQKATFENSTWAEEAKSRLVRNNDPRYVQVLKSRSLDPKSQRILSKVEEKFSYVDLQLMELNNKLDLEWEEHCNNTKKGVTASGRAAANVLNNKQVLYQAILNNQNVLESQKAAVAKLSREVGQLKLKKLGSALQGHGTPRRSGDSDDDDEFVRLADSVVKKAERMKSLKAEDENLLSESFNKSMRVLSDNR